MPVTTRILTFLVGNPYAIVNSKTLFATVTGCGVDPKYDCFPGLSRPFPFPFATQGSGTDIPGKGVSTVATVSNLLTADVDV